MSIIIKQQNEIHVSVDVDDDICIKQSMPGDDKESIVWFNKLHADAICIAIKKLAGANKNQTDDDFEREAVALVDDFLIKNGEQLAYLWNFGDGHGGYLLKKIADALFEQGLIGKHQMPL